MSPVERIRGAVYDTIVAVHQMYAVDRPVEVNDQLILLGTNASLDSMGFVNFIVALEEELEREFGRALNLAELINLTTDDGTSVATVGDLIDVLSERFA